MYMDSTHRNSGRADVREEATTESPIADQETEGSDVRILEEKDGWYLVNHEGRELYMSADYVELGELSHVAMTEEEYEAYQQRLAQERSRPPGRESPSGGGSSPGGFPFRFCQRQRPGSPGGPDSVRGRRREPYRKSSGRSCGAEPCGQPLFPDSISEVIYQSGQFTPAYSGALANVLAAGARSDCYEAAQAALNGGKPVGSCLYFNSGYGQGIQIGYQHFY